ncbi:zinc finger, CCHC-type containing protein [Tanacetum coccineum]
MAATQTTNNNSIRSILEKEKLNGSNFLDWYRNLRIALRKEQKLHHLEEALLEAPPATASTAVRNAYTRRIVEQQEVACLMLVSMTPEIQKNLEDRTTFEILQKLKTMFQQQAEQELFETMERLGYPMPLVLKVNLILTSLSKDYGHFVQNYNMHCMGKTIPELPAMLKLTEKGIPKKTPVVLTIRKGQIQKPKSVEEEQIQYFWHIRARGYRKLNKGALDLYVGNGHSAVVEAIWSFELILPSGMILSGKEGKKDFTFAQVKRADESTWNHTYDGYALKSVARILNMVPTKKVNKTPYEMWHEKSPEFVLLEVDLPPNCKTVGSKWLFKKKTDMDGNIHTYKAHLVEKDFTQTYGVDYEETFSPVADIKAIRNLIAIAAYYDYEIWQMDVKTAFLNGCLNEDVYMVQPEGFENPKYPNTI